MSKNSLKKYHKKIISFRVCKKNLKDLFTKIILCTLIELWTTRPLMPTLKRNLHKNRL
jgi:hypothetical protein